MNKDFKAQSHGVRASLLGTASSMASVVTFASAAAMAFGIPAVADALEFDARANQEVQRRYQSIAEGRTLAEKGDEFYQAGNYAEAIVAYAGSLDMIPDAPTSKDLHAAVLERYAQASVERAREQSRLGDVAGAKATVANVLAPAIAPNHPGALQMQADLNDPIRTNPALTKEHAMKVDQVRRNLYLAEGAMMLGAFDESMRHYQDVLAIDPTNSAARRGMEQVALERIKYSGSAYDHMRSEMLDMVASQWELQITAPETELAFQGVDEMRQGSSGIPASNKLSRIIIPDVNLDQTTLAEAVDFLRLRAAEHDTLELDPERRGINFNVDLGDPDSEVATRLQNFRFDLRLRNVPVQAVLRHINEQTQTSYTTDDFAVNIRAIGAGGDALVTRTYRVPPDLLSNLSASSSGAPTTPDPFGDSTSSGLLVERKNAREIFAGIGLAFPEGATISFSPATNQLTATNTADNLDFIEQIIEAVAREEPVLIELKVTVLTVEQTALQELGFDWQLGTVELGGDLAVGGGTTGNGSAISDFPLPLAGAAAGGPLTSGNRSGDFAVPPGTIDNLIAEAAGGGNGPARAPGAFVFNGALDDASVAAIVRGLDQKKGSDVMATPSTVSRSGQAASVQMVQELIYPTEYEPPEVPNTVETSGISPVTPANPTAFTMRKVGVILDVVPTVDASRRYIEVSLKPEITQFDGFVNYGSPITSLLTANAPPIEITPNAILMPVFSVSQTTTDLTIADGSTFVFSGLMSQSIEIVEDKVPILGDLPWIGRLFQSKVTKPTSKAVIFMVRARLVDPSGRPINP